MKRKIVSILFLVSIAQKFIDAQLPPNQFIQWDFGPEPSKQLDDSCSAHRDCIPGFAECQNGRCACRDGFRREGSECVSETFTCPYGSPMKIGNGSVQNCERKAEIVNVTTVWNDNCPPDFFCMGVGITYETGHCCPKPKAECPVGEKHPTATCNQAEIGVNGKEICPFDSHYCHTLQIGGQPMVQETACCPRPCRAADIFRNGKCHPLRKVNDVCQIDEQCRANGAECKTGRCTCTDGLLNRNGTCIRPVCPGRNGLPVSAVRDGGKFKECEKSSDCSGDDYCAIQQNICCPKPEAYCPNGQPTASKNLCNPRPKASQTEPECGRAAFCFQYYYPIEFESTQGACCKNLYSPADFAGGNLPSADEYEDMTEEQPLEDELQQQPKFAMGSDDLNLEHQIPSNQIPSQIDDNFLLGNSLNENSNPKPKRLTESNRNAAIPLFTGSISFLFAFVFFQFFFLHSIIN